MQIPFGLNDWESESRHVARTKLRNMYIAENPFSPDGISRYSRPSLTQFSTVGYGPIKGIWKQDGTIGGYWLVCSGEELYSFNEANGSAILIGALPGVGYAQFAGNEDRAVILRDGIAYIYDGVDYDPIVMPDDLLVGSVAQIDGAFLLSILDSFTFYWMLPGEITPDPLNFASAERLPDPITQIAILADEIWMIGSDSTEVWAQTGDQDAPYARIPSRAYTDGCEFSATVVGATHNNYPCLFWVSQNKEVIIAQGQPTSISTNAVEEFLRSATNMRAWAFRRNRIDFYLLTTDQGTWAYNIDGNSWSRWDSFGYDYFRGHLGLQHNEKTYAGDDVSNKIFIFEQKADDLGDPIICQISGFVPNSGIQAPCYSVNIRTDVGWSPSYVVESVIELKWSDDYGFTWSEPRQIGMGLEGQYSTDISFRSLGLVKRPGRLFEISFTGLENFRIDYATMNEV